MKNKTLETIQKISNVARIIAKVVYIICLVAAIMCAVGFIGAAIGLESVYKIGNTEIVTLVPIPNFAHETVGQMYFAMLASMLGCIGTCILAKLAEKYFANELKAGTPFTLEGAEELKRLGILQIVVPIIVAVITGIMYKIFELRYGVITNIDVNGANIGVGITLIVVSLLCKYGYEVQQDKADKNTDEQF